MWWCIRYRILYIVNYNILQHITILKKKKLDCEDSSDESREQNCTAELMNKTCGTVLAMYEYKYPGEVYYWNPVDNGGQFKCDNGQCIEFKYLCDGFRYDSSIS